jgi:MFS family permease
MVYPLLPALLLGFGAGPVALGVLDGAADFASALLKLVSGRIADRPGRRGPLVIVGYAIAVAVRPLISLTHAAPQVIALRVTDRFGKGVRTAPRDAIIADATPAELWGRAFGLQRGLDNLGSVAGPLAAFALLSTHALDVPGVIAASIVPGILVLVLAVLAVRGSRAPAAATAPAPGSPGVPAAGWALPRPVALVVAFAFVRLPDALLLLRAQQLGVPVAAITLLWAAVSATRAAGSFVGGARSDDQGAGRVVGIGWIAYVLCGAGFALASAAWHVWILFPALGFVLGLLESPERALVAKLGARRQGAAFGAYHGGQGFAALGGGLLLGALFQGPGPLVACAASAAGAAVLRLFWKSSY